jgi:hypothetical protein
MKTKPRFINTETIEERSVIINRYSISFTVTVLEPGSVETAAATNSSPSYNACKELRDDLELLDFVEAQVYKFVYLLQYRIVTVSLSSKNNKDCIALNT